MDRYAVFHAHTHAPKPGVYVFVERINRRAVWAMIALFDTIKEAETRRDELNAADRALSKMLA
jgi:hypothetical protein